MEEYYGAKELYDVVLKATYPIEVGKRKIEPGEIILSFDSIQMAGIDEIKKYVTAHGGFDDRDLVFWEKTKEVDLQFTQGIFSINQLSLISNSKLIELEPNNSVIRINNKEELQSDENGEVKLSKIPVGELFCYKKETGEKMEFEVKENILKINENYCNVLVTYLYEYVKGGKIIKIGNKLLNGFLTLQAKTRLKEDKNGQTITGIFEIPKLKLMSDLSIRLGRNTDPMIVNFKAVGVPVGNRGKNYIYNLYTLNDDIDSDL